MKMNRRARRCALTIACLTTAAMGMGDASQPPVVSPVANIATIEFGGQVFEGDSTPSGFAWFKNKLYFRATDIFGDTEPYTYDGRVAQRLADIAPGMNANFQMKSSSPSGFTVYGDQLVFSADDGSTGRELWSYDGSQLRRVADINQTVKNGANQSALAENVKFVQFRNELVFVANDGVHGPELWGYNGSQVRLIAEINPGAAVGGTPLGSEISGLTVFGAELVFQANNGTTGAELWAYDGQAVRQLANINQVAKPSGGDQGSTPGSFVVFANKVYFGASDGVHGRELWTYDGRQVQMVPELRVGSGSTLSRLDSFIGVVFGNELVFSATNGVTGEELWAFDGSQYRLLKDINQTLVNGVNQPSNVAGFTVFGGELVFAADDGVHGREVWGYDGRQVKMLSDLNPTPEVNTIWHCPDWFPPWFPPQEPYCTLELQPTGRTEPSLPFSFTGFGNRLVFRANNGTTGAELWGYDHLSVRQLADINPGAGSSTPQGLMVFGNELIFSATDGVTGIELWRLLHTPVGQ